MREDQPAHPSPSEVYRTGDDFTAPAWIRLALPIAVVLVVLGLAAVALGGPSGEGVTFVVPSSEALAAAEPAGAPVDSIEPLFTPAAGDAAVDDASSGTAPEFEDDLSTLPVDEIAPREPPIPTGATPIGDSGPEQVDDLDDLETDPRFPTCEEATAAGYGDYVEGADVEYAWYPDDDADGIVCEL